MKLSIGKQISVGIGAAAFLLLALGFVSYQSSSKLVETAGWVGHTHDVLAELEALSHRIEQAEIGQRNYLTTGVEHYLEAYQAANAEIDQTMSQLKALTADNPGQQRKIDRLLGLIATLRDETRQSVELRKQDRSEDSLQEVLTGSSVRTANVIYSIIGEMQQEEQRLLKQ
jgi:CHASE3 domain sensor protein